jgi:hypothetical protein
MDTEIGASSWLIALLPDVAKILLQFGLTALVAWMAVVLALKRYKSEKLWDLQIEAAAEVLKALQELSRLNKIEMAQSNGIDYGEDNEQKFIERWRAAIGDLRSTVAVAVVVWPPEDAAKIEAIVNDIDHVASWQGDWTAVVAEQAVAIARGHKVIRSIAQDLRQL